MPDGGTPLARRNLGVPDAGCNLRRGQSARGWQKLRRPPARRRRTRPARPRRARRRRTRRRRCRSSGLMLPPVVTTGRVSPVVLMRKPPRTAARSRQRRCSAPAASDRRSPVTSGVRVRSASRDTISVSAARKATPARTCRGSCRREAFWAVSNSGSNKVAAGEPQLHLPQVHHHAGIDVELVAAAGVEVAGGVQGVARRRQAHVPPGTAMDVLQGGPDVQPRHEGVKEVDAHMRGGEAPQLRRRHDVRPPRCPGRSPGPSRRQIR